MVVSFTETGPPSIATAEFDGAQIRIQNPGAYLTHLYFETTADRVVNVLHSANLDSPEPSASHALFPFMPHHEVSGSENGWPSLADYKVQNVHPEVATLMEDDEQVPHMERRMRLRNSNRFHMFTEVANTTPDDMETSLGDRLRFALGGELGDVRVDGDSIANLLGKEAIDDISGGNERYLSLENKTLHLPPGLNLELGFEAAGGRTTPTALALWQRSPDSPYLCVEPLVGVRVNDGEVSTTEMPLKPNYAARITTEIKILGSLGSAGSVRRPEAPGKPDKKRREVREVNTQGIL